MWSNKSAAPPRPRSSCSADAGPCRQTSGHQPNAGRPRPVGRTTASTDKSTQAPPKADPRMAVCHHPRQRPSITSLPIANPTAIFAEFAGS